MGGFGFTTFVLCFIIFVAHEIGASGKRDSKLISEESLARDLARIKYDEAAKVQRLKMEAAGRIIEQQRKGTP